MSPMSLCSALMCSCLLNDFSTVQVLLLEAEKTFRFSMAILVSIAEIWKKNLANFERNSGIFWKTDSTARCNCHGHVTPSCECRHLLCSDWVITYLLEFDWAENKLSNFFLNLDTCVVSIVKVSNENYPINH